MVSGFLSILRNATTSIFGKSWALAHWNSVLLHVNCGRNTAQKYAIYVSASGNLVLQIFNKLTKVTKKRPLTISDCLTTQLFNLWAGLSWKEILSQPGIILQPLFVHVYVSSLMNTESLGTQFWDPTRQKTTPRPALTKTGFETQLFKNQSVIMSTI